MNKAQIEKFIDLVVKDRDDFTALEGSRLAQEHIAALADQQERDELTKYLAEVLTENALAKGAGKERLYL